MIPRRQHDVARAYAMAAAVYLGLALVRTTIRVVAIPRPPAAAALALAQTLLFALPWIVVTPPLVALTGELGWVAGRRARILSAHVALALLLSLVDGAWGWLATGWLGLPRPASPAIWYLTRLDQALFLYLFLAGAGVALRRRRDLDAVTLRAARLEARLLDARLHVLSLQLHPHFLFNTLNAVSELVHRDPAAAAGVARRLRSLLDRSFADHTTQEVPLREEVALLEAYADIQRLRFQGALTVEIAVDPDVMDAAVPRLVLQPLVENAIRHGTARRAGPGRVSVRGRRSGELLVLEVLDDARGLPPGTVREGLGLGNTRARLRELYGDAARLDLRDDEDGTLARIELPLRSAPTPLETEAELDGLGVEALTRPPRPIGWKAMVGAAAVGWLGMALLGTHEDIVAGWIAHDPEPFLDLLRPRLGEAMLWVPLTVVVLRLSAALARRELTGVRLAAAHLVAALCLLGLHLLAVRLWVTPDMDGTYAAAGLIYNVCAYVALAAASHAWTLGRLLAERSLEAARLERDLGAARLATLRWRLDPDLLRRTLETIATLAEPEPHRADELTGQLGESLRGMLAESPS
ncbi:MAG TPA: histidine kinase [Gemmatimonadales bacterium]|nr:histidine kinase [Gemmatimonadales bacterium]